MSPFRTRLAWTSDYRALARLCRRAVGPRDYVLHYLREVIQERGVFLAFDDDRLVGMTNFEKCIDGSGWLGMARTDPDWRRKGVATFLQGTIARHARRNGIKTLRLWVFSKNTPALKACKKGGFKAVCTTVHVSQIVRPTRRGKNLAPTEKVRNHLARSILLSAYLSKMNGYMPHKWHIVKPDQRLLRRIAERREFYLIDETAFLLSIPDYAAWNGMRRRLHSEFTLLQGPAKTTFHNIKEAARGIGIGFLGAYVPRDYRLLANARREGFRRDRWADHCVVFEKQIA